MPRGVQASRSVDPSDIAGGDIVYATHDGNLSFGFKPSKDGTLLAQRSDGFLYIDSRATVEVGKAVVRSYFGFLASTAALQLSRFLMRLLATFLWRVWPAMWPLRI